MALTLPCGSPGVLSMAAIKMLFRAEQAAWMAGVLALVCWVVAEASGTLGTRREMQRFVEMKAHAHSSALPDQHLWSPLRVRAWQEAQGRQTPPALAVLRIARI